MIWPLRLVLALERIAAALEESNEDSKVSTAALVANTLVANRLIEDRNRERLTQMRTGDPQ